MLTAHENIRNRKDILPAGRFRIGRGGSSTLRSSEVTSIGIGASSIPSKGSLGTSTKADQPLSINASGICALRLFRCALLPRIHDQPFVLNTYGESTLNSMSAWTHLVNVYLAPLNQTSTSEIPCVGMRSPFAAFSSGVNPG